MTAEMRQLKDKYLAWLGDEITLRKVNDWLEITAPFLDRHNDYLQIYIRRVDSGYLLTDDGYIINDLEMGGCELNTPRRRYLLQMTLNGFGVQYDENTKELYICASSDNFALRKHSLLQAMLAVNDLFYLATPHIKSFFLDDVESWLEAANIRFTPRLKFTGASGLDHQFHFVIPKSRHQPERILLGVNRPDRSSVERTLFAWGDTKAKRSVGARAYAVLNDRDKPIAESLSNAYSNCGVVPVLWSRRDLVKKELAA